MRSGMTTCKVEVCDREASHRGWCNSHYSWWQENGVEPTRAIRPKLKKGETNVCKVEVCDRKAVSRGWCTTHYSWWKKHGEEPTHAIRTVHKDMAWRFLAKMRVDEESGCWIWTANRTGGGRYGGFGLGSAHVFSYKQLVGPIPEGYEIDHLCRVTLCVNPDHLEAVTRETNWLRSVAPSSINAHKTHCIRGHEFTPENTRIRPDRARECRTCAWAYREVRHRWSGEGNAPRSILDDLTDEEWERLIADADFLNMGSLSA